MLTIGQPVQGGTPQGILFVDASGNLAEDAPAFIYQPTTKILTVNQVTVTGVVTASGLITANGGISVTGTVTASGLITANAGLSTTTVAATGNISTTATLSAATITDTGLTSGSVPFIDASHNLAQNNAAFFWDATNARVGIGGNAPAVKLDVTSGDNVAATNIATFYSNNRTTGGVAIGYQEIRQVVASAPLNINPGLPSGNLNLGPGTNNYVFIAGGGAFVGVNMGGGHNPAAPFVVSNLGNEGLEMNPTGGNVTLQTYNRTTVAYAPLLLSASTIRLEIAGTDKAILDGSGRWGIGTISPTSPLHVVGLPTFANNAAAVAGGLTAGAFYHTGLDPDEVAVVH